MKGSDNRAAKAGGLEILDHDPLLRKGNTNRMLEALKPLVAFLGPFRPYPRRLDSAGHRSLVNRLHAANPAD